MLLKKNISIGIGIGIAIVVILGLSWVIGNNVEKTSSPSGINNTNSVVSSPPAGKTYHLNFSESVGIKAQP
jgi:hypothetical protein